MKITTIILRTLMGLLFLFTSITYFFKLIPTPPTVGAMKMFNDGLLASVYIMPAVKICELICGLSFLSGRFVPLASILISPIIVNIFFINLFLFPKGLPIAIFLVIANSMVAYSNRECYKPLFRA